MLDYTFGWRNLCGSLEQSGVSEKGCWGFTETLSQYMAHKKRVKKQEHLMTSLNCSFLMHLCHMIKRRLQGVAYSFGDTNPSDVRRAELRLRAGSSSFQPLMVEVKKWRAC